MNARRLKLIDDELPDSKLTYDELIARDNADLDPACMKDDSIEEAVRRHPASHVRA